MLHYLRKVNLTRLIRVKKRKMYKRYLTLVGIAVVGMILIGTITTNIVDVIEPVEQAVFENPMKTDDTLRLIIVGDTGGLPIYPYYTYAQSKIAKIMDRIATQKKVQYILSMGDNLYFTGAENEYDSRFKSSFENVYNTDALNIPWYMLAGNHDHFGNISAQIAYTNHSRKWVFPDYYYKLSFNLSDISVDILMLDTIVLCGNTADVENGGFFDLLWNKSHDPEGPVDVNSAKKHWKWIEHHLNTSIADYLLVAGHYPIHSLSSHGPTKCLKEKLDPLLKQFNVSAYLSGHDHTLQHVAYPGQGHRNIHYIISGAASRSDRSIKNKKTIPNENIKFHYPSSWNPLSQLGFSNGGFVYMQIGKVQATFSFLNGKGNEKYQASFPTRNSLPKVV